MMLRDRYYLGYVTYDGEEYQGRHEPLIAPDIFDRVQNIHESRSTAGNAAASTTTTSKAPCSADAVGKPASPNG